MKVSVSLPGSSRVRWALFGAIAFVAAALWVLPLSVVLRPTSAGVSARTIDGTAWNGRVLDASVAGARLGDIGLRLMPMDLLTGKVRYRLASLSAQPISGDAISGLSGSGVRNLDARLTLGGALQDLGLSAAQLTGLSLNFRNGKCVEASGQMTAYLSDGGIARATGPQLSGPANCVNGQLSFRLTDPQAKAALTLVYPDGKAPKFDLLLKPNDALDKGALQAMGFRETPVGFRRSGVLPR